MSDQAREPQPQKMTCPWCRSVVALTDKGALSAHPALAGVIDRCVGSGVTIKGEQQ